jgi:hypothetical protein
VKRTESSSLSGTGQILEHMEKQVTMRDLDGAPMVLPCQGEALSTLRMIQVIRSRQCDEDPETRLDWFIPAPQELHKRISKLYTKLFNVQNKFMG